LALRNKIIAADIPLLSPEEIEEEVRVRRGEDE
jgi:2-phospho-L-lactate guanylyltransferase (CobY/MobA/RfbA family)